MTIDYKSDLATIINEFDVLATQKRPVESYNNKGLSTTTFTTVITAYVDIQPASINRESFIGEEGKVEIYSHTIYGCYSVSGAVLSVLVSDRFYVDSDFYEVKQVIEYDNAHLEIHCNLVKGKV